MSNENRYKMTSTSHSTSRIEDIELSQSKNGLTRQIVRAEIIENPKDSKKSVKFAIIHQRRAKISENWAGVGGPGLSQLHAGEAAKIQLDTTQTQKLLYHLLNLYEIGKKGVRSGKTILEIFDEDKVIRTDCSRARIIKKLLEKDYGTEIWKALAENNPDLATKISLTRIYEQRKKVVEEIEKNISHEEKEEYWRKLLMKNNWIFGSNYQKEIKERRVNIKSTVDHPLITEDNQIEIVEIKRPQDLFWKKKSSGDYCRYRERLVPSHVTQGAIAQAMHYILETEKQIDSKSWAEEHEGIYPIKPRAIVVLGRSNLWGEEEGIAYRILNDALHGIVLLTFDQLLFRAKNTVELFNPKEFRS